MKHLTKAAHVGKGVVDGGQVEVHLLLALVGVLVAQVARATQALVASDRVLAPLVFPTLLSHVTVRALVHVCGVEGTVSVREREREGGRERGGRDKN